MGIQGLLPLLKSIHKPCSLKTFAGQTIGVDAYGWLHRGTVACATELALGKPTTKFVDFAMSRVRMLKHFGITPYIVFDGDYLPSKSKTEKERSARRKESRRLGMQLLDLGKTAQAYLELQKAVDVTPEMAGQLIEQLKLANVQYVVAPYEADSQLAYLEQQGIIDGILSEDSDLLVFGAKRLLTKLDQYGECVLIRRDDFTSCKEVSLVGWSDQEFRRMCIMSGCDYLASIDKMGLKTAYRLIRKHKTIDRVIRSIQFDGKFKVPPDYLDSFIQAERTFLHQWVFCPVKEEMVNYNPLEPGMQADDLPYIGGFVEASVAAGVAAGKLHPHTKLPLQIPTAPGRSFYAAHKRETLVETPDLKKTKPIESFFKPKRTPLAELDPNSFAGSPSQQHLIRRASGSSWPATPVTRTLTGTTIRSAMNSTSVPAIARRSISDNVTATRSFSDRAPKRQRLCSDASPPNSRVESGKSRFFASQPDISSPSARVTRMGKGSNADINLWSDDSIEDALLDLPDPSTFPAPNVRKKRIEVYDETSNFASNGEVIAQAAMVVTTTEHESQQTVTSMATSLFSQQREKSTPPSSPDASQSEKKQTEKADPFAERTLAEVRNLSSEFSYNSSIQNKSSVRSSFSRTQSAPSKPSGKTYISGRSYKPLEMLHTQNLPSDLPKVSRTLKSIPQPLVAIPNSPEPRSTTERNEDILPEIEDSAWQDSGFDVCVPASDNVENPSPVRLNDDGAKFQGSEDLLVSESEAGSEDDCSSPKPKPILNLKRFAFGI